MIAFEELVAALDRWRIRNGLPVVTGDVPTVSAPAQPAAQWAAAGAPAWSAAPALSTRAPAPTLPDGEASDVLSIGDDEVLEDEYDNDGDDFAMKFGAPAPDPEATASGPVPSAAPPAMPGYDDGAPPYDPYAQDQYGQSSSGPYAQAGSGPYPTAMDSGPAAAVIPESDPAYDDPAYDPPGAATFDRPLDDEYPPIGEESVDADLDVVDEATVVGDGPKR